MKINLIPFFCDAITLNRKIYKDIDRIYNKNKYLFYRLARESKFYTNPFLTSSDFLKEEYNKKLLGILIYSQNNIDKEILDELENLIKNSYPYTYSYYMNNTVIDYDNFHKSFLKKMGGLDNITDDELNSNFIILYFLGKQSDRLAKNDKTKRVEERLVFLTKHSEGDKRISLNDIKDDEELTDKLNSIAEGLKAKDRLSINKYYKNNVYNNMIAFLFDYEKISTSMFDYIDFSKKDILEILYLLELSKDNNEGLQEVSSKNDINNIIIMIYFKYMMKAYNNMKKLYFENNKETMYLDFEEIQIQLNGANKEINKKDSDITNLRKEIDRLSRENKKLSKKIKDGKLYKEELVSLRNNFFDENYNVEDIEDKTLDYQILEQKRFFVLGGHDSLQQKLKEFLKNSDFIHTDLNIIDLNIIDKADSIIIFPNYLNHKNYGRVMDRARKSNKKILHINITNVDSILLKIMKFSL